MFLAALIDAGVDPDVLRDATSALNLNASLRIETVDRSGISCTKVHVMEGERLAEDSANHSHSGSHSHSHFESGARSHAYSESHANTRETVQQPVLQQQEESGKTHWMHFGTGVG